MPAELFVDTSAWFALADRATAGHRAVVSALRDRLGKGALLVTTNLVIAENRAVTVSFEDAASAIGLRKPSERSGEIRVVTIADVDRSACGGTHVRATGEIGGRLLRRSEELASSEYGRYLRNLITE